MSVLTSPDPLRNAYGIVDFEAANEAAEIRGLTAEGLKPFGDIAGTIWFPLHPRVDCVNCRVLSAATAV